MRRSRKPVWAVSSIEGSNPSLSAPLFSSFFSLFFFSFSLSFSLFFSSLFFSRFLSFLFSFLFLLFLLSFLSWLSSSASSSLCRVFLSSSVAVLLLRSSIRSPLGRVVVSFFLFLFPCPVFASSLVGVFWGVRFCVLVFSVLFAVVFFSFCSRSFFLVVLGAAPVVLSRASSRRLSSPFLFSSASRSVLCGGRVRFVCVLFLSSSASCSRALPRFSLTYRRQDCVARSPSVVFSRRRSSV